MKNHYKIALVVLAIVVAVVATILFIQNNNIPVLDPKGIIGQKQRDLLFITTLLMLIVVVPAIAFTLIFAFLYRKGRPNATYRPEFYDSHLAEIVWWGVPSIIIIVLAVITYQSSYALDPYKPIESDKKPITIQVVALEWKWLFIYPEQSIATINFIQFPVDTPINFEITADAPMNSFWIPQLGGQIYAMQSMRTELHLMATEAGVYRGCSSNLSGEGFSGMVFQAKASSEQEFNQWVKEVKNSSKFLTLDEYNVLVTPSEYVPASFYKLEKQDLFNYILTK
ncbi:MAG: ubiquinol oxidase subunit II [Chlamydiae bacterium]|nr:ubiquinol oxidase subunit II [Chlamydiota bacterium]